MLKESEILYLKERVSKEELKAALAEKDYTLARKELECQIADAQEAYLSKSTLNESMLNISQEKDHRIVDLEQALDAT